MSTAGVTLFVRSRPIGGFKYHDAPPDSHDSSVPPSCLNFQLPQPC
jgi:hypothetical protein